MDRSETDGVDLASVDLASVELSAGERGTDPTGDVVASVAISLPSTAFAGRRWEVHHRPGHSPTDTVFLAVFPGGWRVVAAGCTPHGDRPYDCVVQGG